MKENMTRIQIVGFGNVGQSVFKLASQMFDVHIQGIVTRRVASVAHQVAGSGVNVYDLTEPSAYCRQAVDVAIMCGGSKDDLAVQTPYFAKMFPCVVDSFDTHGHIDMYVDDVTAQPKIGHFSTVDMICRAQGHTAHIGIGWDPGSFSLMRAMFKSMPGITSVHAFYGLSEKGGLSMGHTNALKTIPGVIDALQFTHAKVDAIDRIRRGEKPILTDRDKHWRECFVVIHDMTDQNRIKSEIKDMPLYFAPFDTAVHFVTQAELDAKKDSQAHDGLVIGWGEFGYMEFKNVWNSNPMATASFLLAYAKATHKAYQEGRFGCFTVLDTPIRDLLHDPSDHLKLI